jgi:alanine racemase
MNESFDHSTARGLARPNVFEINLGAVANCTRRLRSHVGLETYFFATLKANAYGYGLIPVARMVLSSGADAVSLANLDDAIRLRRAGIKAPILVFAGYLPGEQAVRSMEKYDLIPSIYNEECLATFTRFSRQPLEVAVKVDVGPERIGVPAEQAAAFIQCVMRQGNLRVKVVHAHPSLRPGARAGECLEWQYQRFLRALAELRRAGVDVPLRVFASSKVLKASGHSMLLSAVDPGAALFTPLSGTASEEDEPFFRLKSRIIQVREVTRDQFLEEAPFKVAPGMRIGIIPFGYSDGLHRLHCGEVLVHGSRVRILGSPALEYCRIDLTGIADTRVGDEVVIVGRQGQQRISPQEVLQAQGAARVPDLALELKGAVSRRYLQRPGPARKYAPAGAVESAPGEPVPCNTVLHRSGGTEKEQRS